jgi:hypothetical protein
VFLGVKPDRFQPEVIKFFRSHFAVFKHGERALLSFPIGKLTNDGIFARLSILATFEVLDGNPVDTLSLHASATTLYTNQKNELRAIT